MGRALMAEFPALQLWTDAYLGDTTHLTTIEHGAYLLLLMTAWRSKDTRLPDDDRLLARYSRLSAQQWKRLRPILAAFFTVENGFWVQRRLTDEAVAVRQNRERQAAKGRASALKRKGRHSTGVKSGSIPVATGGQPEGNLPTATATIPLSNDNGAVDSDKRFWDDAKAYLGKGKASLIGQWVRDHGKEETASAIAAAQVERAVDPVEFIQGRFRKSAREKEPPVWDGMP
jgi:uncharacterized protein YdaU (DUF1376 family)